MSKVDRFRLSDDNPREIRAKEVIDTWISKGYSLRYILTEVLVNFEKQNNRSAEMDEILTQLKNTLGKLEIGHKISNTNDNANNSPLSSRFVEAIKTNIRSGTRS